MIKRKCRKCGKILVFSYIPEKYYVCEQCQKIYYLPKARKELSEMRKEMREARIEGRL